MAQVATNADLYAEPRQNAFFKTIYPSLEGQCVTLVKCFMEDMTSVPNPHAARGDAKLVGKTLVAQGHAVEVPFSERKRGDLICYEYGEYGHIAVQLSGGRVFEQNVNLGGVQSKIVDGQRVYASRIGSENEAWRVGKNPHAYRIKTYSEGNNMTPELAAAIAKWGRLLAFNSVAKMSANQANDIKQITANPMYAAALLEALYKGDWQVPAWKANNFEAEVKKAYEKGKVDGAAGGGNVPAGTYLKIDKSNIVEVE